MAVPSFTTDPFSSFRVIGSFHFSFGFHIAVGLWGCRELRLDMELDAPLAVAHGGVESVVAAVRLRQECGHAPAKGAAQVLPDGLAIGRGEHALVREDGARDV